MTLYITAQLVGLIGYVFLIAAPQSQTQSKIMRLSILASLLLCSQWFILEQYSLLMTNVLLIVTTLCALYAKHNHETRKYLPLLYPLGISALLLVSNGTIIDMVALTAFSLSVASRCAENLKDFRIYAICAGITLTLGGAFALSIPAVLFNAAFTFSHISKLSPQKTIQST